MYSSVVKKHEPNDVQPKPVPYLSRSTKTKQKSKTARKREIYKPKLSRYAPKNGNRVITINNTDNEAITKRTMNKTNDSAKNASQSDWKEVSKKHDTFENALPKTFLLPKAPFQASYSPQRVIGISLSITPGLSSGTSVFITPKLLSKVLSSFQHVDSNACIIPLSDDELQPLTDATTLLTMEDDKTAPYVWVPKRFTKTYRCAFKLKTDLTLNDFKMHHNFMAWIKQENIQLDSTYLIGQDTTRIGFLINRSVRGDIINLHESRIQEELPTVLKWQFDIQASYIRSPSDISEKVIMIRSPKTIAIEMTNQLHTIFNSERSIGFYPIAAFNDLSIEQKNTIIQSQKQFLYKYRTVTFKGFKNFDWKQKIFADVQVPPESLK
jgi:hypothetical protein